MAKILGTFSAIERYELARSVDSVLDPYVPRDIKVVHACVLPPEPWTGIYQRVADAKEPLFAERGHGLDAACGRWVKVYLPKPFDSEDPKACQQCKDAIGVKG